MVHGLDPAMAYGRGVWSSRSHTVMLRKPGYAPSAVRNLYYRRSFHTNVVLNLILDPEQALDEDGDGLPDPWEDAYRLRALAPTENGAGAGAVHVVVLAPR